MTEKKDKWVCCMCKKEAHIFLGEELGRTVNKYFCIPCFIKYIKQNETLSKIKKNYNIMVYTGDPEDD